MLGEKVTLDASAMGVAMPDGPGSILIATVDPDNSRKTSYKKVQADDLATSEWTGSIEVPTGKSYSKEGTARGYLNTVTNSPNDGTVECQWINFVANMPVALTLTKLTYTSYGGAYVNYLAQWIAQTYITVTGEGGDAVTTYTITKTPLYA